MDVERIKSSSYWLVNTGIASRHLKNIQANAKLFLTAKQRLIGSAEHEKWTYRQWFGIHWGDKARLQVFSGNSRDSMVSLGTMKSTTTLKSKVKFSTSVMV